MNFDHIIMNPPYDKNLHLKILKEAMQHSKEIVNLSPIRWLQDPLAEYKKNSDFKKFEDIIRRIKDLEVVPASYAEKLFNIGLPFNLGVYHITKNGNWKNEFRSPLLNKMVKKCLESSLKDHIIIDDLDGISLLISLFTGGRDGGLEEETPFMMKREKCFFTNKVNDITEKTYLEQRTETAWGNVKPKGENTNIKFSTKEERENFYSSWNTKCLRWLFNKEKVSASVHPQFLPYLGDYTHPWTDEMLYEYFGLNEEEIKEIEQEIK